MEGRIWSVEGVLDMPRSNDGEQRESNNAGLTHRSYMSPAEVNDARDYGAVIADGTQVATLSLQRIRPFRKTMLRRTMSDGFGNRRSTRHALEEKERRCLVFVLLSEVIRDVEAGDGLHSVRCEKTTVIAAPRKRRVDVLTEERVEGGMPVLNSLNHGLTPHVGRVDEGLDPVEAGVGRMLPTLLRRSP